ADDIARAMSRCCLVERGRFSNPRSGICRCEPHWRYFVEKRRGRSLLRYIYRQSGSVAAAIRTRPVASSDSKRTASRCGQWICRHQSGAENFWARINEQEEAPTRAANVRDRAIYFFVD